MGEKRDGGEARASEDVDRILADLNARIASHVAERGTRHAFGTYVDPTSRRVVVETDAPDAVVDALLGDDRGSALVEVRRTRIVDTT